jgi:acetylglutamate kinase
VTDDATLDMAKMVFAGKINTEILAALRSTGAPAVGLSGIDGNLVEAVRRPIGEVLNQATGARETIDYGHVGDVVGVNTGVIEVLLQNDYLPVVASLAADAAGYVFNINADTLAAEIAVHLAAEKLVLLGDTDGIYRVAGDPETKLSRLTLADAEQLMSEGTATGGMIPKLQSLTRLLTRGVRSAHIINGNRRNTLLAEVFTDEGTGTMVVNDER